MSGIMQKRIALFFVAVLFLLALVPAYYPVDDEALRKDSPFCNAYDQLFSATNAYYWFGHDLYRIETSTTPGTSCSLPKAFASAKESRAPPA
jgi:hypothetical protein